MGGQNSKGSLSHNSGINTTVNFIHSSGYLSAEVGKYRAAALSSKKERSKNQTYGKHLPGATEEIKSS